MARDKGGAVFDFLSGSGEVRALMRAHDWSASPLGHPAQWPQTLKNIVTLILDSTFPMFILWGEGRHCLYNDAYTPIISDRHPAGLGRPFAEIYPDIWPECAPLVADAYAGKSIFIEDFPLIIERHGHHVPAYFTFSYSPLRNDAGAIVGMYCVCTETTPQVRDKESLRHRTATLQEQVEATTEERDRVWNNSRDLLAVVGANGIFRAVSPSWKTILGYDPHEVVGRSFLEFIYPVDKALTQGGLDSAAAKSDLTNFENRYVHKNGTPRWISWHTSVEGDLVYAYGRDITLHKEQAAALARAEEQLHQAQKMEAVGQLTGGIAHDFNNMLAGVMSNLDMLRIRLNQHRIDEMPRYIDGALKAVERAAALTHRLLAFSRRQRLDSKPTDINKLVLSLEDLIRRTIGPGIYLETRLDGSLWTAQCDPNQLESAVLNLSINSRDAMPGGGRLIIETANAMLDHAYAADHGDVAPGCYVRISVSDTGVGMTPEVAGRVLEPFFTTKPLGQGTGLGLSMIYGFVKQSQGHMRIDSEPGRGTSVQIFLPRHAGQAEGEAPKPVAEAPPAHRKLTVLLVDDEESVRTLSTELLSELGYKVLQAADGPSGVERRASVEHIDLLITDVGLPNGMNGRQLADALRIQQPGLKVLFITGFAEPTAIGDQALEPGMQLMAKPFSMAALARQVRGMLEEG